MPSVEGWFIAGRPLVRCEIVIPRLRLVGELRMLVDTGSDASSLSPSDARDLGVTEPSPRRAETYSFGGATGAGIEQALVVFRHDSDAYAFEVRLLIPDRSPATIRLPSLLGRDVLNRVDMAYSPLKERLRLSFDSADQVVRGA